MSSCSVIVNMDIDVGNSFSLVKSKPVFEHEASHILLEQRGHATCVLVNEVARAC